MGKILTSQGFCNSILYIMYYLCVLWNIKNKKLDKNVVLTSFLNKNDIELRMLDNEILL